MSLRGPEGSLAPASGWWSLGQSRGQVGSLVPGSDFGWPEQHTCVFLLGACAFDSTRGPVLLGRKCGCSGRPGVLWVVGQTSH